MQTAPNLGKAIRIFNRYFDVAGPVATQSIEVSGSVARWITQDVLPTEPARRVAVEELLSGNFTLFHDLSEGKFALKELHLDYPAPSQSCGHVNS